MKVLTLIVITISLMFLLENCKINKNSTQNADCTSSEYCIINFLVSDTNQAYSEVVPFVGIADLSEAGNGEDTDINGNAIVTILRPNDNIALFEMRYLSLKDTFSVSLNKCEEQTNTSYYLPKWFKDSLESLSIPKEIHFIPHGKK